MCAERSPLASRRARARRALAALVGLAVALPTAAAAQAIAVHGRVEDEAKRPVAGATARLYPVLGLEQAGELHLAGSYPPPPAAEAKAGASGAFSLAAPRAAHWRIVISAAGRADRQVMLAPLTEETWLRPVALPAEAPLEVRVVAGGAPIPGALVAATLSPQRGWFPGAWVAPAALLRTGPDGRAVISRAAGDRLDLAVAAEGYAVEEREEVSGSSVTVELRQGPHRAVVVVSAAGDPAPGALVMDADRRLPLGRTGPGGRLMLTLRAGEPVSLHFSGSGGATARATVEAQAAGATRSPVAVRLAAPVAVTGRVIDAQRRRPVPGALVWLVGGEAGAATTDAQGGYRLTREAARRGTQGLQAAAAGFFAADAQLVEAATTAPTLALDPAGSVTGSVADPQGRPVSGVEVTSSPIPERRMRPVRRHRLGQAPTHATSDERGRYRLTGLDPRSRHRIVFRRAGHAPLRRDLDVPVDRPGQLDVVLSPGVAAHGLVVDEGGEPVSGAELSLRRQEDPGTGRVVFFGADGAPEPEAQATSDRAGGFAFVDLAPGRYELSAVAPGFAAAKLPGVELPEGVSPLDLGTVELTAGVSISGRVVDARGQAIPGADVFALDDEEAQAPMLRWALPRREPEATTAADGSFVLSDHRAGERVTVAARRGGFTAASAVGVIAPNEEPVVIVLRQASAIRGRVVDGRGDPVAGAQVSLRIERSGGGMSFGATLGAAPTREDGSFVIEDVEPGTVSLGAQAEGFLELVRGGVEVHAGRDVEGIELVLQPGAFVEGVVSTPDGAPAIGAQVALVAEGDRGGLRSAWFMGVAADGDGRYRLSGVAPGRRTVAAQLEGFEAAVAELEVVEGENRLDLRLGAGHEVSGRVTGPEGDPVAGASVGLAPPRERMWSLHAATTDDAGAFTIAGVPDGAYEATATHPEHAEGRTEVTVAGGPVTGLVLELAAAGAIAGALRGLEPEELGRVWVNAWSDRGGRPGIVGRDGRYRVSGASPGRWRVMAEVEGGGRQAQGTVELAPGQAEATLDLEFTAGLAVHGVVRHEGRPVDGAQVLIAGQDVATSGRTQTDYRGRYRIENLSAGRYQIEVAHLQRGLGHRSTVTIEQDRELDVELHSGRIAGRVLEATSDEPVTGAQLELEPRDEETARFRTLHRARSDDRGAFVLASVGVGRWRLVARKEGYAPSEVSLELTGEGVEGVELRLQPTQGIALSVARTNGAPPEQVYVAVIDAAGRVMTGGAYPTTEGGAVRVSTAPAGSWDVLVRADGTATARVTALSPGPPVPVLLAPQAILEVLVPELDGDQGLATVTLRGGDGRPFLLFPWASEVRADLPMVRGRTLVRGLPAGAWTVEVTARDGRRWSAQTTTAAGAETRVELR